MEKVKENNFLGTENVGKLLKIFAIPCVLSLIIQSLYNLVDQIFIGHCETLGATGNAATGIVYPLTIIALAIGLWLGDGCAACISLNQGKNDTKGTSRSVGTALFYGALASIIYMLICFVFKDSILTKIGGSGAILISASEYANFIIMGFLFFILACVINPIIRADGSPRYAMLAMAIGAVINIALDPLFIYVFDMGMTGAALATFLGQTVTFILHVLYLFKTKTFKLKLNDLIPCKQILNIMKFGISSLLTQLAIVIISIVNNMLLFKYSVASGYDTQITQGVITLAFKVFGIVVSIIVGIASGGQPILGYNFGAKRYDRVRIALKYILTSTVIVGVLATIIFELFPQIFLFIFGNGGIGVDHQVYSDFTKLTFRIYLGFILLTCITKVVAIFFQAIGSPVKATIITMSRDVIFLVPLAIILVNVGGIGLLLWSAPISDVLCFVITIIFTINALKQMESRHDEQQSVESDEAFSISNSQPGIIITIAREHGASGREIGKLLADRLQIPYYDKDLTMLVAESTGLSMSYIESIDEGNVQRVSDLYLGLDPTDIARIAQKKVLQEIASRGQSVIVGRAADYVLKDQKLLKVFIHAPMEYRIKQIMRKYGDNISQASKNIQKSDRKRSKYYELITGNNWGDYHNYNLIIDSSIGVDNSVAIIIDYLNKI